MIPLEFVQALMPELAKLTPDQFSWVQQLVASMVSPLAARRDAASDIFSDDRSLSLFALYLVTHHSLSAEPFKQEKVEYALEKNLTALGRVAKRAKSRTNPGHDLTVDGERWSLKTAAHKDIKDDPIHITKWMELGKGQWGESEQDLRGLCDRFLRHLGGYDRIVLFRCLTPEDPRRHHYELLEIPKDILTRANAGAFTMMHASKQAPKPGYSRVSDGAGLMYELYFDGGSERKLRVQKLRRDLCRFHAEWRFESPEPKQDASAGE